MGSLLHGSRAPIGRFFSGRRSPTGRRSEGLRWSSGVLVAVLEGTALTELSSDPKPVGRAQASLAGCCDMVSYYNSIAMFPHAGRPAPGPPTAYSPYTHPSYTATSYQHDTNQNIQLAYAGTFGSADFGTHPPWNHSSWSSFPTSCRSYEWPGLDQGAPPPADAPATPPSDPALPSPTSPAYHRPDGSQSPAPSSEYHYKPALSPPQYKAEPSSTSDLVSSQLGPGDLSEDCPSPASLSSSRPQPARSPYEWMKKPAYPSPPANHDPNGKNQRLYKIYLNEIKSVLTEQECIAISLICMKRMLKFWLGHIKKYEAGLETDLFYKCHICHMMCKRYS